MARTRTKNNSFLDMLEDKYGTEILETKETLEESDKVRAISTGSLSLDVSIGVGGIPRGRITEIYGPEGSSKTTLALSVAKNATKVLYIDTEFGLDLSRITQIVGDIDTDKFILTKPVTAEEALEILQMGIVSKEFDLVVLDSVASLSSAREQELDDYLKTSGVGQIAKLLAVFLRKNMGVIRSSNTAVIFINQVRDSIGNPYGGFETPGGRALKHFASLRIQLSKSKTIMMKDGDKEIPVGIEVKYTTKKNKLSSPFQAFSYTLDFNKGIEYYKDVVEFASILGVIVKRGSWYAFEGETLGQGSVEVGNYLKEHKEVLDKIVKMVYTASESRKLDALKEGQYESEPESN